MSHPGPMAAAGYDLSTEADRSPSGMDLARFVIVPRRPIMSGAVMVHGLGDHSQRHRELWAELAGRGIAVVATDLPGHGQSAGRRGHIDSMEEAGAVIDSATKRLRELVGDKTLGIGAHSMGSLLVLDYFGAGGGAEFRWIWLGSSLINPAHGQPAWKRALGERLAPLVPRLTIPTGLHRRDLYHRVPGQPDLRRIGAHRRVSLRWGVELLRAGERLRKADPALLGERSLLMTHGSEDCVCPPGYAREFFERVSVQDKRFELIGGGLHEPYEDPRVLREIGAWVSSRL